jgi:hypothetical protein
VTSEGRYRTPPEGWRDFGFHAPLDNVPPLTWSDATGEDGLPLWERHDGCTCDPTAAASTCPRCTRTLAEAKRMGSPCDPPAWCGVYGADDAS